MHHVTRTISILFIGIISTGTILASTPTWSAEVAPILFKNCTSCHREQGIAPFSLTTYGAAAEVADFIADAVTHRVMPPYPADISYRRYAHERTLTDAEIATIKAWADAGAPSGDLSTAPDPPTYNDGPRLQMPDLTLTMPTYTSTAKNADVYRCFTIPTNEPADRYVDMVEVVPGNASIVHHVLVYVDTTDVSERLDATDPEPGYPGFGGVGSESAELIGVWAPGGEPFSFPRGFGLRLPKGSRIILQVHYPRGTQGETDATSLRLRFSKALIVRPVLISPVLNQGNMLNGPLRIPANTIRTFQQRYTVPIDASVFAVAPHMHLIGKSTKVWAMTPANDSIPLISIPHWDFHWQMAYTFPTLLKIPQGTQLRSEVTYDNTSANEHNPSDPPKDVRQGEATTDEMILTFFFYTIYMPGDENIRLDTPGSPTSVADVEQAHGCRIRPNPTSGHAVLRVPAASETTTVTVVDMLGRSVMTTTVGASDVNSDVPFRCDNVGAYVVRVQTSNVVHTLPLRIVR